MTPLFSPVLAARHQHRPELERAARHQRAPADRRRLDDRRAGPRRTRSHHLGDRLGARRELANPHLAGRGKLGVLVALGAAIVCGASVTLVNFFWNVGQQV